MTIFNIKNAKTGEEKKCIRLDTIYNEIKNITGSERAAQRCAEWAENAQNGQKKSAVGKYTLTVQNAKEAFTK